MFSSFQNRKQTMKLYQPVDDGHSTLSSLKSHVTDAHTPALKHGVMGTPAVTSKDQQSALGSFENCSQTFEILLFSQIADVSIFILT